MDEADLRAFMATDYRRLVGGFSMIVGGWAAAEDAVEEAVARAWERSRRGEPIDDLTVWVAVVARNILRSAFLIAEHADLLEAVARLPRRQREAVALFYFVDLSVAGVARVTASTEGAVKVLLHRARRALAVALGDGDAEEVDLAGRG